MSTDGAVTAYPEAVQRAGVASASSTQEFGDFFLSRFLGLEISYDDEAQSCSVVLPYAAHLTNPQGSMHGGVITTAMDISMGHLSHHYLSTAMTVEMTLRFFRPLKGTGIAVGRILNPGRRLVHLESRMTDEDGRLVAHGVGAWHRLDALG